LFDKLSVAPKTTHLAKSAHIFDKLSSAPKTKHLAKFYAYLAKPAHI